MQLSRLRSNKGKDTSTHAFVLPENTPLEFHVLLSACRVFLGTEEPERLEGLLGRRPDWDKLLALASRHGVMPLLYRSIGQVDKRAVPQEWMAKLRAMYMQNAARNIRMNMELLRILDALKEADIKAVPLKGPVLAQTVYGDVALRQFSDLDILVAPDNLEKALDVLRANRCRCIEDLSIKEKSAFLRMMHHYHLFSERTGTNIELHWKSSPTVYGLQLDVTLILTRAKQESILGKEISNISEEDQLALLCLHGVKHTWQKLSWVCDVAASLVKDKMNLQQMLETAHHNKDERVLLLGFSLVRDLLCIDIPEGISKRIDGNKSLQHFNKIIINNYVFEKTDKSAFQSALGEEFAFINIYDSLSDRIKFFLRLVLSPVNEDFTAVRLPDALFPLYYLIRPARLMKTYKKALWNYFKQKYSGS